MRCSFVVEDNFLRISLFSSRGIGRNVFEEFDEEIFIFFYYFVNKIKNERKRKRILVF